MDALLIFLGIAGAIAFVILCFKISELGQKFYGLDLIFSWSFPLVLLSLSSVVATGVVTTEYDMMIAQCTAVASIIGATFINVWKSTPWFGILFTIIQTAVLSSVVLAFFIWADSRKHTHPTPRAW